MLHIPSLVLPNPTEVTSISCLALYKAVLSWLPCTPWDQPSPPHARYPTQGLAESGHSHIFICRAGPLEGHSRVGLQDREQRGLDLVGLLQRRPLLLGSPHRPPPSGHTGLLETPCGLQLPDAVFNKLLLVGAHTPQARHPRPSTRPTCATSTRLPSPLDANPEQPVLCAPTYPTPLSLSLPLSFSHPLWHFPPLCPLLTYTPLAVMASPRLLFETPSGTFFSKEPPLALLFLLWAFAHAVPSTCTLILRLCICLGASPPAATLNQTPSPATPLHSSGRKRAGSCVGLPPRSSLSTHTPPRSARRTVGLTLPYFKSLAPSQVGAQVQGGGKAKPHTLLISWNYTRSFPYSLPS